MSDEKDDLLTRLRRQYPIAIADPDFVELAGMPTVLTMANPDGPEAADRIEALEATIAARNGGPTEAMIEAGRQTGRTLYLKWQTESPLWNDAIARIYLAMERARTKGEG